MMSVHCERLLQEFTWSQLSKRLISARCAFTQRVCFELSLQIFTSNINSGHSLRALPSSVKRIRLGRVRRAISLLKQPRCPMQQILCGGETLKFWDCQITSKFEIQKRKNEAQKMRVTIRFARTKVSNWDTQSSSLSLNLLTVSKLSACA